MISVEMSWMDGFSNQNSCFAALSVSSHYENQELIQVRSKGDHFYRTLAIKDENVLNHGHPVLLQDSQNLYTHT